MHSHCMEHFFNPLEVVKNMAANMQDGSWMFISIPNMQRMYEKKFTNVLNFEHTFYCAEPYVSYMLNRAGYEVVQREIFKDDHSVFYAARLNGHEEILADAKTFNGCYERNKELFTGWLGYHEKLTRAINDVIGKTDQVVYLFGAHVFSQYLIAFGMKTEKIAGILDNDVTKHGKRLEGTDLIVSSPKILAYEEKPLVILCAGTHNAEIKEDIISNINPNTLFVP